MIINPDSEIASPIRIEALVNRLEDYRAHLRQELIKRRLHIKSVDQADQHLLKELRLMHLKVDLDDADQVDAAIAAIKDYLKVAPVLHFTFSTPPTPAIKNSIVDWLHQEIDPTILADFSVDGGVAAGFWLRTRNQLFDFSANGLLWKHRTHITELVKNV